MIPTTLQLKPVREKAPVHIPTSSSSSAAEARVTKTLLLVSTVFLVLNLPAHAIRCGLFVQSLRGTSEGNDLLHASQPWTNILFNTNFAVNFLLYCVSGRNFRKTLKNIVLRKFSSKSGSSWRPVRTTFISKSDGHGLNNVVLSGRQERGFVGARKCVGVSKELQVTEIIELEDKGEGTRMGSCGGGGGSVSGCRWVKAGGTEDPMIV